MDFVTIISMSKQRSNDTPMSVAAQVVLKSPFSGIKDILAVTGLNVHCGKRVVRTTAVTVGIPGFSVIEKLVKEAPAQCCSSEETDQRDLDLLLTIVRSLSRQPDVFICHAHGIAHPLRAGLASLLGVALKRPVIGCTQALAHGQCDEPPPGLKGGFQYIRDGDSDILGISLRTRPFSAPVFVSPGHLMDVETAGDIILACCTRYRLPEPLRFAMSKK